MNPKKRRELMTISVPADFFADVKKRYADERRKRPKLSFSQFIREAVREYFKTF